MLDRGEMDPNLFWDQNISAFRETVLVAMRETSEALRSAKISLDLRTELEGQAGPLKFYLEIANSYLARRGGRTN
jgi:hypothetical protein